jgi:hypothetical protein
METCLGNSRPYLLRAHGQYFLPLHRWQIDLLDSPFPTRLEDHRLEVFRELLNGRHGNLQQASVGLLERLEVILLDVSYNDWRNSQHGDR